MAVGFPLLAAALTAAWIAREGWGTGLAWHALVGLVVVAALAERVSVQIGPRSVYTPSVPAIAVAALLGGPLAGCAAGLATQLASTDSVWRRRGAWGGLAATQGLVAGLAGEAYATGSLGAPAAAGIALLTIATVNTAGRLLILVDRDARPIVAALVNGVRVDLLETVILAPVLSVLLLAAPASQGLAVLATGALVAGVTIAHRQREDYRAMLAAEQAVARRDPLTGAPNRRAFEEALVAEHARVVRGATPAGLLIVDIDRFKTINDDYRHDAGDDVLVEITRRLTDMLRPSDLVARWGGDEITVLGPGIHSERQLDAIGERIRELIDETPIVTGTSAVRATVSVGGTLLDGSVSPTEAMANADEALYRAKRSRNATAYVLPDVVVGEAA